MTIHSKNKGARGEREVAAVLTAAGFPSRRGQQFSGSPDSPDVVNGLPFPAHVEVKRTERFNVYDAYEQAVADKGPKDIPLVWHRRSRKPWLVVVEAQDFLALVKRAYPQEDILG